MNAPRTSMGSVTLTEGIRIAVAPFYLAEQSEPGRCVFGYRIRITNDSERRVRLLSRHWVIVDADGERHEVRGEGVVGRQPTLAPGESHSYSSFCPLPTPWGTMEGEYTMTTDDGKLFQVAIGRFYLAAPDDSSGD
jgi:ApaG protein